MIRMVMRKVYLRPTRSPSRPKTSAPNGRTRKPAAKASSAKMLRVASGYWQKNCAPMMAAERAVEIEVVPLEDGAERGGKDDLLFLAGHRTASRRHLSHGCLNCHLWPPRCTGAFNAHGYRGPAIVGTISDTCTDASETRRPLLCAPRSIAFSGNGVDLAIYRRRLVYASLTG